MRIVFLGCSGGRRITFQQKRASGGFLIEEGDLRVHVDPGPGALLRLIQLGFDPSKTDVFIISHRHMDHVADINTVIEARTLGGWNPGGILIAPEDALYGEDPVVYRYHRDKLKGIHTLKEGFSIELASLKISSVIRHPHHGVETFGVGFEASGIRIGYITDGRLTDDMLEAYRGFDALIVNTTFRHPRQLEHLSLEDAVAIASRCTPKLMILNHFGAEIVFWGLDRAAEYVEERTGIRTISAREFMEVKFGPKVSVSRLKLVNPICIAYKSGN